MGHRVVCAERRGIIAVDDALAAGPGDGLRVPLALLYVGETACRVGEGLARGKPFE